uniref:Response regulator n=1 Tax=Litorilinea aerophila TaxID=1204385 RepID=A0A540VDE6_9CHLR
MKGIQKKRKETILARILVIDDESEVRAVVQELLESVGYEVEGAPNGKVGLQLFRKKPADLIIADILMPEQDGLETILTLLRERPDTKIVAMSGGGRYGLMDYLEIARRFGVRHTIRKPFTLEELVETVQAALGEPSAGP